MDKLPLGIRRDLRDTWESPKSPAQQSIAQLTEVLGLPVRVDFEVAMIWAEMQKVSAGREIFVPSVVGAIKGWVDCLIERLEDDANAKWADQLLEHVNRAGHGQLIARVETTKDEYVKTCQGKHDSTFIIAIPEAHPPFGTIPSSFTSGFQVMFEEENASHKDDDQINVVAHQPEQANQVAQSQPSRRQPSTALPALETIPRPERLFELQLPYHIIVKVMLDAIWVQGSHQPSLELLDGYLRKYTRSMKGLSVQLPRVKIQLQDSHFGMGLLFDSVSIEKPESIRVEWVQNPVLILSFVEGVLGYHMIFQCCTANQWYFRREENLVS